MGILRKEISISWIVYYFKTYLHDTDKTGVIGFQPRLREVGRFLSENIKSCIEEPVFGHRGDGRALRVQHIHHRATSGK